MSMYFCDFHNCFHDDDWIPMEGENLCGEAVAAREEALSQFKADLVREHVENTEKRYVH